MTYAPILIGLTGDGTWNGVLINIVNRGLAAAAVIVAGFFAWKMITTYLGMGTPKGDGRFATGGGRHAGTDGREQVSGSLVSEAVAFAVVEGLLASIWLIVNLGQMLVGGVAT
jgi:hypothetical protein